MDRCREHCASEWKVGWKFSAFHTVLIYFPDGLICYTFEIIYTRDNESMARRDGQVTPSAQLQVLHNPTGTNICSIVDPQAYSSPVIHLLSSTPQCPRNSSWQVNIFPENGPCNPHFREKPPLPCCPIPKFENH